MLIPNYVLENGQNGGLYTEKLTKLFKEEFDVNEILFTSSCTDALEMCALLLDIKPGDEIIMPSYTFVSTANAFVLRGAIPVYIDISLDDLNISSMLIEEAITNKTKAIVVVHYAGNSCDMDTIVEIAKKHNLPIIEDAAQGIFSTHTSGKYLGTIGDLGVISFHATKNYSCGEGGALFINNNDYLSRAHIILEKGTDRYYNSSKYSWVDLGSSFGMSDIQAYVLYKTFRQGEFECIQRADVFNRYNKELSDVQDILTPLPINTGKINGHIFYLLMMHYDKRDEIIRKLNNKNIAASNHYIPLHMSGFGKTFCKVNNLFATEFVYKAMIRLPTDVSLSKATKIVKTVRELI